MIPVHQNRRQNDSRLILEVHRGSLYLTGQTNESTHQRLRAGEIASLAFVPEGLEESNRNVHTSFFSPYSFSVDAFPIGDGPVNP
jgi:hypothetical protein